MFSTEILTYCTFYKPSGSLIHNNTSCFISHGHSAHISGQNCSCKTWGNSAAFFLEGSHIRSFQCAFSDARLLLCSRFRTMERTMTDRERESFKPANSCFYTPSPCWVRQRIAQRLKKKCSALLVLHSYLSALTNKCSLWFWNGSLRAFVQIAFYTLPPHKGFHTNASCGVDHNYVTQNNEKLQLLHKNYSIVMYCDVLKWNYKPASNAFKYSGKISQISTSRSTLNINLSLVSVFLMHVKSSGLTETLCASQLGNIHLRSVICHSTCCRVTV